MNRDPRRISVGSTGFSRAEQDELSVRSHRRAVAAQTEGLLADQIIPVTVTSRSGDEVIDTDEHPRADTSVESLSKLKPMLVKQDRGSHRHAGETPAARTNAASMCFVTTPEKAAELGLRPLVRPRLLGHRGRAANVMGIGPVPATELALRKAGLKARRHGSDRTQ